MDHPTLPDVTELLQTVSGVPHIDPDDPLIGLEDVDSLDLIEWLYSFQERYPHLSADESLFENIDDTVTMRSVFEKIMAAVPATASGA